MTPLITKTAAREPKQIAQWSALVDRVPTAARVADVDLVILRLDEDVHVLYGRCTHRNALLAEGRVEGDSLVCAHHGWDYDCRTGRSKIDDEEALEPFTAWRESGAVWVDEAAVRDWRARTPMDFYADELDV